MISHVHKIRLSFHGVYDCNNSYESSSSASTAQSNSPTPTTEDGMIINLFGVYTEKVLFGPDEREDECGCVNCASKIDVNINFLKPYHAHHHRIHVKPLPGSVICLSEVEIELEIVNEFPPLFSLLVPYVPYEGGTWLVFNGTGDIDTDALNFVIYFPLTEDKVEGVPIAGNKSLGVYAPPISESLAMNQTLHSVESSVYVLYQMEEGTHILVQELKFLYYREPVISAVNPGAVAPGEDKPLTLSVVFLIDTGFARCKFESASDPFVKAISVNATVTDPLILVCSTPTEWDPKNERAHLSISLNGQQYSNPIDFSFVDEPSYLHSLWFVVTSASVVIAIGILVSVCITCKSRVFGDLSVFKRKYKKMFTRTIRAARPHRHGSKSNSNTPLLSSSAGGGSNSLQSLYPNSGDNTDTSYGENTKMESCTSSFNHYDNTGKTRYLYCPPGKDSVSSTPSSYSVSSPVKSSLPPMLSVAGSSASGTSLLNNCGVPSLPTSGGNDEESAIGSGGRTLTVSGHTVRLCELVGSGTFSEVYRGIWCGTSVAVKMFSANRYKEDDLLLDFEMEVSIIRHLRAPNILLYLGSAFDPPNVCIVTEYMSRGNLHDILHNRNITFEWPLLLRMMEDTARGMTYLHSCKPPIVHRDLKSCNLLVDEYWKVKIGDFGLSMAEPPTPNSNSASNNNNKNVTSLTETDSLLGTEGSDFRNYNEYRYSENALLFDYSSTSSSPQIAFSTPGWAAPEVLINLWYSRRSDVYSFGIVLWECLMRSDPYPGMTSFKVIYNVSKNALRPEVPSWCPAPYAALMRTCWAQNPMARPLFPDILDLILEMEEYGWSGQPGNIENDSAYVVDYDESDPIVAPTSFTSLSSTITPTMSTTTVKRTTLGTTSSALALSASSSSGVRPMPPSIAKYDSRIAPNNNNSINFIGYNGGNNDVGYGCINADNDSFVIYENSGNYDGGVSSRYNESLVFHSSDEYL